MSLSAIIEVPEWVLMQSCRYAWGRRSYAVGMTADHLRGTYRNLSNQAQEIILRDLKSTLDERVMFDGEDNLDVRTLRALEADLEADHAAGQEGKHA